MTDRFRAEGWWRDGTILDDLRRAVVRHPDKPALICYQDAAVVALTYAELSQRVDRIAGNLVRLGVRPGDVVSLQMPNSWQLVALCLAASRIGAVPGPIVPIMRRREVEYMLRLTESPVYVAAARFRDFSYAHMSAEVARAVPTLRHRILIRLGGGIIALYVALRATNLYGDASKWSVQPRGAAYTVLSFLNVTKYPPSLLYALMTLGCWLALLPMLAIFAGAIWSLWRFIQQPTPQRLILNGLGFAFALAIVVTRSYGARSSSSLR